MAAKACCFSKVQEFIANGADVNAIGRCGTSPLLSSVAIGLQDDGERYAIVQALLDAGANINSKTNFVLGQAVLSEVDFKVVECLVERGIDLNKQTGDLKTPLHMAAGRVGLRSSINICNAHHLEYCARVFRYLVFRGADPAIKNWNGESPVELAKREAVRWQVNERPEVKRWFQFMEECIAQKQVAAVTAARVIQLVRNLKLALCLSDVYRLPDELIAHIGMVEANDGSLDSAMATRAVAIGMDRTKAYRTMMEFLDDLFPFRNPFAVE